MEIQDCSVFLDKMIFESDSQPSKLFVVRNTSNKEVYSDPAKTIHCAQHSDVVAVATDIIQAEFPNLKGTLTEISRTGSRLTLLFTFTMPSPHKVEDRPLYPCLFIVNDYALSPSTIATWGVLRKIDGAIGFSGSTMFDKLPVDKATYGKLAVPTADAWKPFLTKELMETYYNANGALFTQRAGKPIVIGLSDFLTVVKYSRVTLNAERERLLTANWEQSKRSATDLWDKMIRIFVDDNPTMSLQGCLRFGDFFFKDSFATKCLGA